MRHYQNIRILWTIYTSFDRLVPVEAQFWDPPNGHYLPLWMKYQVFTPIFLLQLVIAFWSYLILRILFKMLRGVDARDSREEGEMEETDVGEEEEEKKEK